MQGLEDERELKCEGRGDGEEQRAPKSEKTDKGREKKKPRRWKRRR